MSKSNSHNDKLTDSAEPTNRLDTDAKHHLLSSGRRRLAVALLERHDRLSKGELADRIAAREHDGAVSSQERKRVYISLHQCHLPKLADYGVVEERPDGYILGSAASGLLPMIDELSKTKRASAFLRRAMGAD